MIFITRLRQLECVWLSESADVRLSVRAHVSVRSHALTPVVLVAGLGFVGLFKAPRANGLLFTTRIRGSAGGPCVPGGGPVGPAFKKLFPFLLHKTQFRYRHIWSKVSFYCTKKPKHCRVRSKVLSATEL